MQYGLSVRIEAKAGKENDVANFLKVGLRLAQEENFTPVWFALRLGPTTFGIFDAFKDEVSRNSHLTGEIAKALMKNASELLASAPIIERCDVLGSKLP